MKTTNVNRLVVSLALAAIVIAVGGTASITKAASNASDAAAANRAYYRFSPSDSAKPFANNAVLASLTVPAGLYAVSGKLNLDNDSPSVQHLTCRMRVGDAYDVNVSRLDRSGTNDTESLPFHVLQKVTASTAIRMSCEKSGAANVAAGRIRIVAVEIGG